MVWTTSRKLWRTFKTTSGCMKLFGGENLTDAYSNLSHLRKKELWCPWSHVLQSEKLCANVAVPPAPVLCPECHVSRIIRMVMMGSRGLCIDLLADENPGKYQLGYRLKAVWPVITFNSNNPEALQLIESLGLPTDCWPHFQFFANSSEGSSGHLGGGMWPAFRVPQPY